MRGSIQAFGFFLLVAGVSGFVDHLCWRPFMGGLLNIFERQVFPRLDVLAGYELWANPLVSVLGLVVLVVADDSRTSA